MDRLSVIWFPPAGDYRTQSASLSVKTNDFTLPALVTIVSADMI